MFNKKALDMRRVELLWSLIRYTDSDLFDVIVEFSKSFNTVNHEITIFFTGQTTDDRRTELIA